ncbi:uncharacterized protein [Narcine bancroftii]|uniref:uncharacterized protein isoform X2 n=1 Tax=Narcine bancroftii TaxID=1343680 RepID=UPI0038318278
MVLSIFTCPRVSGHLNLRPDCPFSDWQERSGTCPAAPDPVDGESKRMAAVTKVRGASRIWIALKRLDLNDDEVAIVKDVWILQGLDSAAAKEVLFHSFGLEDSIFVLKLRNSQGSLIPINSALNINSKQSPYILEVVKLFQHVVPKRRNAVLTVTSKSLKNRLQSIMKRIDRLDELGPEISMKWKNKLSKEMGLLNQKLQFLDQRMQATSSNLVYCASLECGSIISQLNFLSRTLQDNSVTDS